jgi:FixJ family two-component response regulator
VFSASKIACIIDDDASVRNSIEQLLDSDGLKAQSFEDAEDFLAYARRHVVPLAILDVWMPKTSGLEVQAQLRVVSPKTKVIVMSAREISAIRAASFEGGALPFSGSHSTTRRFSPRPSSTQARGVSAATGRRPDCPKVPSLSS